VFSLAQNYPNPFNPSTTIRFMLPRASEATLTIFNVLGQEIAHPVNGWREAGEHIIRLDAAAWPSGVYFYRLTADGLSDVRRMMVIR
jgi:hypothetical protein